MFVLTPPLVSEIWDFFALYYFIIYKIFLPRFARSFYYLQNSQKSQGGVLRRGGFNTNTLVPVFLVPWFLAAEGRQIFFRVWYRGFLAAEGRQRKF